MAVDLIDADLERIRTWPFEPGAHWKPLIDFVRPRWAYADCGYWIERDGLVYAATAGWSENEELLQAMRANGLFWGMCFVVSAGSIVLLDALAPAGNRDAARAQRAVMALCRLAVEDPGSPIFEQIADC